MSQLQLQARARRQLRTLATAALLGASLGWSVQVQAQSTAPAAAAPQAGAADAAQAADSSTGMRSTANPANPTLTREDISYATGVSTVRNFQKNKVELDIDAVVRGMRDALAGGKAVKMSDREIRAAMNALQVELRRQEKIGRKEATETNLKRGAAYQSEFRARPGVQALPNGILYREVRAGSGAKPSDMDNVVVKYRGTLVDGTEFDATENDRPVTIRLVNGITGWREALKQMPVGARWEVVIPHTLAYGERGVPGSIGPNETLVFDVELLDAKR